MMRATLTAETALESFDIGFFDSSEKAIEVGSELIDYLRTTYGLEWVDYEDLYAEDPDYENEELGYSSTYLSDVYAFQLVVDGQPIVDKFLTGALREDALEFLEGMCA